MTPDTVAIEDNTSPIYLFDLDGTLADIDHRKHLLEQDPVDWGYFYALCPHDKPMPRMIQLYEHLRRSAWVEIWTGRNETVRSETVTWLRRHTAMPDRLCMRPEACRRAAHDLKRKWLAQMLEEQRRRVVLMIEDNPNVVEVFRGLGVQTLLVNQ